MTKAISASVKKAFDSLAEEWNSSRTRQLSAVPLFLPFLKGQSGSLFSRRLLDAGCGNGRNTSFLASHLPHYFYCVDFSSNMLAKCRLNLSSQPLLSGRVFVRKADVSKLPFKAKFFDSILSAAVLHHLPSQAKRLKAFKEMFRVLKPGGLALITVWNKSQKKFRGVPVDASIHWTKSDGELVSRFYHFYSKSEFFELAEKAGFLIEDFFYEKTGQRHPRKNAANICLVLKRPG